MTAPVREIEARNARIDALLASDDRRRLTNAINTIDHISTLLRAGNSATDVMATTLRAAGRDLQAVQERMNQSEAAS